MAIAGGGRHGDGASENRTSSYEKDGRRRMPKFVTARRLTSWSQPQFSRNWHGPIFSLESGCDANVAVRRLDAS